MLSNVGMAIVMVMMGVAMAGAVVVVVVVVTRRKFGANKGCDEANGTG